MLFNSWQFLVFLVVTFVLYFVLPKKIRHYELLIASYFFYAFWNWKLVFLILGTTVVSFLAGFFLPKIQKKWARVLLLVGAITISLGVLFFFKYFDFMAESIVNLINMLHGEAQWNSLNLILPIGISFYTFQTLSYVIDVYKGKYKPENNFFFYALYVSFFPQLVAGPIERPENLLPQLKNQEGINTRNMAEGMVLMLIGFIKKIAIADMIGIYVNNIFSNILATNGLLILVGTLLFSIQILCDFSGYSDIAKGVAKMFNIDLMVNFNHPYKSQSIKEFWSRWHISLSSWLRDYVYIPLGGNRVSIPRWIFNILIVFLISGIWHGANWTFVIWGLMHGVMQVIEGLLHPLIVKACEKKGINYNKVIFRIIRTIFTFIFVMLTWIPFRANNINEMAQAYRLLFTSWNFSSSYFTTFASFIPMTAFNIVTILLGVLLFNVIDYLPRLRFNEKTSGYILRKGVYVVGICLVVFCFIYLQNIDVKTSFIYFQF